MKAFVIAIACLGACAGCSLPISGSPAAERSPDGPSRAASPHRADLPGPRGTDAALPRSARSADIVLIGEVHDNVEQHRLRLRWLDELTRDRTVALALEQLDADRQPRLERARAHDTQAAAQSPSAGDVSARARKLAEAGGFEFRGWDWELYRPVIELALRRGLPLVAANLSSADTARVARGGVPAAPEPPGWRAADTAAMEASIRAGHCGLLPEKAVAMMATAQRTRDAQMAESVAEVRRRTGLPVVLLAGNGHVRRDIGVPRHLAVLRPSDRIVSIALIEADDPHRGAFDHVVETAHQVREDPCQALRERTTLPRDRAR